MLKIDGLQAAYGHSQVLFDVSLEVNEGELVTLMGRNGMGKTTTIRTLMGLLAPKGGKVQIAGRDTTSYSPEKVARLGVGLVPEGRQIFPTLTVRENLVATASNRCKRQSPWDLSKIYALFPRMQERADQTAGTLSGGEQQMLAIGRAMMNSPKLLILDEPVEGLAPVIVEEIVAQLKLIRTSGVAVLLVEQNLEVCMQLADRHYIIEGGRIVYENENAAFMADTSVKDKYLSVGAAD